MGSFYGFKYFSTKISWNTKFRTLNTECRKLKIIPKFRINSKTYWESHPRWKQSLEEWIKNVLNVYNKKGAKGEGRLQRPFFLGIFLRLLLPVTPVDRLFLCVNLKRSVYIFDENIKIFRENSCFFVWFYWTKKIVFAELKCRGLFRKLQKLNFV